MTKKLLYYIESCFALFIFFLGLFLSFYLFQFYSPGTMTLNGYEHKYFGISYLRDEGWTCETSPNTEKEIISHIYSIAGEEKKEICDELNINVEMLAYSSELHTVISMIRLDFEGTEYEDRMKEGAYFGGWDALLDYYESNPKLNLRTVETLKIDIGKKNFDGLYFESDAATFVVFFVERDNFTLAVTVEAHSLKDIQNTINNYIHEI